MRITVIFFFILSVAALYAGYHERHLIYIFRNSSALLAQSGCDEGLWKYNPEQEDVIERCIVVSGTVTAMHAEDDGDENIRLRPDPDYVHLLNIRNIFAQWGELPVEPICENPPTRKSAIASCQGYISKIVLPKVGDHITVMGSYGRDKHGWTEIHPVTKISVP